MIKHLLFLSTDYHPKFIFVGVFSNSENIHQAQFYAWILYVKMLLFFMPQAPLVYLSVRSVELIINFFLAPPMFSSHRAWPQFHY